MTGVPLFRIKPVAFSDDPRDNEANFRKQKQKNTPTNGHNIYII